MTYRAPLQDLIFSLRLAAGRDAFEADGIYADLAGGLAEQTLAEAAKFAEGQLLPLDRKGDRIGARFADGAVTTPPGWREAYAQWRAGGWNAIAASPDFGGHGPPVAAQRRLHGNLERDQHLLRALPAAEPWRHRGARGPRQRQR